MALSFRPALWPDQPWSHASKIAVESEKNPHCLPKEGVEQIIAEADGSFLRIVSFDKADTDNKDDKDKESVRDNKGDARKNRQVDYREVRLCAAAARGSAEVYYAATFDEPAVFDDVTFQYTAFVRTASAFHTTNDHTFSFVNTELFTGKDLSTLLQVQAYFQRHHDQH